jgi:hypothetical protein
MTMTRPSRAAAVAAAIAMAATLALAAASPAAAQSQPPVTGTVALEGTMKKIYRGVNVIIVATMDGVEHAYHFTKDLIVHGGKSSGGVDLLEGLREGSTVVVHYTVDRAAVPSVREVDRVGDEGLYVTEGRVSRLNRGRKQLTIKYDNGSTEVFELTDRASAETPDGEVSEAIGEGRVVIYYRDENGRKIVHFFRKLSD